MHHLRTCSPDIYNQEPNEANNDNRAINTRQCPAKSNACYNTFVVQAPVSSFFLSFCTFQQFWPLHYTWTTKPLWLVMLTGQINFIPSQYYEAQIGVVFMECYSSSKMVACRHGYQQGLVCAINYYFYIMNSRITHYGPTILQLYACTALWL